MDIQLASDIIAMLPKDRTLFHYHKDRYALMLLEYAMQDNISIAQIKRSPYAKLLDRPLVKGLLATSGNGKISAENVANCWPIDTQAYVLTLGLWGWRKSRYREWQQTSRAGANLVLQLNFDRGHDTAYQKLVGKFGNDDFSYSGHPINKKGRTTLAWARIDLDLDSGEALIEELQTDWVRKATQELENQKDVNIKHSRYKQDLERYMLDHLQPHVKSWSEAMLSASLFFLIREIGIRNIWLHDFDTGNRLKKIQWSKPPRSLYTSLPKRFCFQKVNQPPAFLLNGITRKLRKRFKDGQEQFWKLAI